jgi:predicted Zn-dependent protease
MSGFLFKLGQIVGTKVRQANWLYRSLTGTEAEAVEAEYGVGWDLARALVQQLELDASPAHQQLVGNLGSQLVTGLRQRSWRFQFRVIVAPEINAFALPGGFIFVTGKLLEVCADDNPALAFALAHEMGHVIRRHAIDRMMANTLVSGVLQRWPVGGRLLHSQIASLLNTLLRQGYSREQELEADTIGLSLLGAAGFDTGGARRLLLKVGATGAPEPWLGGYLASHPSLEVRRANLENSWRR